MSMEFLSVGPKSVLQMAEKLALDVDPRKAMSGRLMLRTMPHVLDFMAAEFGARINTAEGKQRFAESMASAIVNLTSLCAHLSKAASPCKCTRAQYIETISIGVGANLAAMVALLPVDDIVAGASESAPQSCEENGSHSPIATTHEAPGRKQ